MHVGQRRIPVHLEDVDTRAQSTTVQNNAGLQCDDCPSGAVIHKLDVCHRRHDRYWVCAGPYGGCVDPCSATCYAVEQDRTEDA